MSISENPQYVYQGGTNVMRPPFLQSDAILYGFLLEGDLNNLQSLCDKWFNHPSQGKVNYRPLTHYVLLTFVRMRTNSLDPQDKNKGWVDEINVCFWVFASEVKVELGFLPVAQTLVAFPPYVFVNNPFTVITGWEIFGYPKNFGQFDFPDSPEKAEYFSVNASAFKNYSPETQALWQQVLEVTKYKGEGKPVPSDWKQVEQSLTALKEALTSNNLGLIKKLIEELGKVISPENQSLIEKSEEELRKLQNEMLFFGPHFLENVLKLILNKQVVQLFLKQFPGNNGQDACYQSIVESTAQATKIRDFGLLPGNFEFTCQQLDSQPIQQDLGFHSDTQNALLPFWVVFDFEVL